MARRLQVVFVALVHEGDKQCNKSIAMLNRAFLEIT